jgi:hypothetical protein
MTGPPLTSVPIAGITIGDDRIRRDLGDIKSFAESIADIGLLNPITIDENGRLLSGSGGSRPASISGGRRSPSTS